MMVSKILRTLQQKEFIKRQENQQDTRSKLVFLTENGTIKLQEALKQVEITDNEFFSEIEQNDEFNNTLLKLISYNTEL